MPLPPSLESFFTEHLLPEIIVRTARHYHHLDHDAAEEAIQDCCAIAWMLYVSATDRKKTVACSEHNAKGSVTPSRLAWYANRLYDSGRRFAGSSSTDAMAPGTIASGRSSRQSLDFVMEPGGTPLAEVLADPRLNDQPYEQVRVNHDYPEILRRTKLGRTARKVWQALLLDHEAGHVKTIAKDLNVTPGRVVQAKREIGHALEAWGYGPVTRHRNRRERRPGKKSDGFGSSRTATTAA